MDQLQQLCITGFLPIAVFCKLPLFPKFKEVFIIILETTADVSYFQNNKFGNNGTNKSIIVFLFD